MLIVLLRHGETAYNAQRRYQGKAISRFRHAEGRGSERRILRRTSSL